MPQTYPLTAMPRSLLVVNDNDDLTETLRVFFEIKGYAVAIATNGREALDQLEGGLRPGLILLDLMMPVMSGTEFRAAQWSHPDYGHIPVVVISVRIDLQSAAENMGAVGFVRLPGELDRLIELVQMHCG